MTTTPRAARNRAAAVTLIAAVGIGGSALAAAASTDAGTDSSNIAAAAAQDQTEESAQDSTGESPTAEGNGTDRAKPLAETLAPLVTDGTLTQEQADTVATTLAESSAGKGRHQGGGSGRDAGLDLAADTLGMTSVELREELGSGESTLADIAEAQGVDVDTLIEGLVAQATEEITERVADGSIDQENADERISQLTERLATMVQEGTPQRGAPEGRHGRGPDSQQEGDDEPTQEGASNATT